MGEAAGEGARGGGTAARSPDGICRALSARTLRWYEDAHLGGARLDHATESSAPRRALRRPRRAHASCSARTVARDLGGAWDDHLVRDALDFGGGISRRSRDCSVAAAGAYPPR